MKKKTINAHPKKMTAVASSKNRSRTTRATKKEYKEDFFEWTKSQCNLLKTGQLEELDINNLIEEIESLGKNDKRALKSQLTRLLMHLLKQEYQPEKQTDSHSWTNSLVEAERAIKYLLEDSPSLKNELKKMLKSSYEDARQDAAKETGMSINKFPKECPYKLEMLFPFLKKK